MHRTTLSYFSLLSLLLTVPFLLPAQSIQSGLAPTLPSASAAAYYYIAKPGELTMQVNVWGFVQKPERYEVFFQNRFDPTPPFGGSAKLENVQDRADRQRASQGREARVI